MSQQRIAVLGAGPMGLGVAYQLVKDGYQPVVFDADDRIGGQTASFDFGGLSIERYFHYHCTSDTDFTQVLDELGLGDKLHWVPTKMGFYHGGRVSAWGNPWALLRFPGLSMLAKFRYGLHAFLCTRRKGWADLDGLEASAWLKRWVGQEAFDVTWSKLLGHKFHHYADKLSAAWIWSRVHRMGRSRYSLMKEKLGYLEGGSDTLLQGLQAAITAGGGSFRLNSKVQKVRMEGGRVLGVELDGVFEPFDKVISSVPLPFLPAMLPDLPASALDKLKAAENIGVVCVIAKLKRPVTDNFWLNVNDPEMDIPGLIEYSNLRPMQHSIVYVPFYLPGEHPKYADSDEVFADKIKRYVNRINPAITADDFIDIKVSRYRHAQPICRPGHLASLPPMALPVQGLWAADTSYYYPEDRCISESLALGRRLAVMATT